MPPTDRWGAAGNYLNLSILEYLRHHPSACNDTKHLIPKFKFSSISTIDGTNGYGTLQTDNLQLWPQTHQDWLSFGESPIGARLPQPRMKIVIVEDQAIVRDAIRQECVQTLGHDVVGETDSGAEAVDLIVRVRPDVVILDLGLPKMDGFAVAALVRHALPDVRILVLSGLIDDYAVFRIEKAGVHGFVDKNADTLASLKAALDALDAGKTWFSPTYQAARLARQNNPRAVEKLLTETERHILALIGKGLADDEIAKRLGIAPTTAQTHRSNILQKLGITGTPKLVAYAIRHGFTRS